MVLQQYWTIVAKQWKLIIICCVLGGLGAFIGSKLMTPLYQATAFVAVHSGGSLDYPTVLADNQLVQTEVTLATSGPVLSEVTSHYPSLTGGQVAKEVTALPVLSTSLFSINVLDASPTQASALANDIAVTLIKQQTELSKQDNARSQQQLQQDLQQTQQQISDITSRIAALQATNGKQAEISNLSAQLLVLQQHYSQGQLQLVQLEAQNFTFLRVAQPAQTPFSPARPNKPLNTAAGLLVGLFLGIVLALWLGLLDTRVRTPEALAQLLGWPILATMWRVHSKNEELVEQSVDIEGYSMLRSNIDFSAIDRPLQSLVVTSATPEKSNIAGNLAIFMARAGKNTLLIDADLRHPTLHEKFHLPADAKGLSNAVLAFSQLGATGSSQQSSTESSSDPSLDPYLHTVDTPNLRVMPSGSLPPNPPELLNSKAMERLLFTAITNYGAEMVIFDTSPLLGLPDTSMLAPKVDGTVVVVDIAHANKKHLERVKALLTQVEAHVLGSVVSEQGHSRKDLAYSSPYTEEAKSNMQNETATAGVTVKPR